MQITHFIHFYYQRKAPRRQRPPYRTSQCSRFSDIKHPKILTAIRGHGFIRSRLPVSKSCYCGQPSSELRIRASSVYETRDRKENVFSSSAFELWHPTLVTLPSPSQGTTHIPLHIMFSRYPSHPSLWPPAKLRLCFLSIHQVQVIFAALSLSPSSCICIRHRFHFYSIVVLQTCTCIHVRYDFVFSIISRCIRIPCISFFVLGSNGYVRSLQSYMSCLLEATC